MLTRRELCTAVGGAAVAMLPASAAPAAAQTPPAGPVVALLTPRRLFDSRTDQLRGRRKLASGESVAVTVAVEGFALSAFLNVTVTETEGAGYLVVFASDLSGERPIPSTSNINWWMSGLTLANLALTAIGGENAVAVRCDGGGRTHVVVDLYGYVPSTG